ncbi:MAG: hypothetical protein HA491_05975 [Candidatus Verstraetearchaeota archaeon]|nr:hypothetical protein [Candidatus Verstraetearchaeota archaeon]
MPANRNPPVCEGPCEEELMKREKRSKMFSWTWIFMIIGLLALMIIASFSGPR